jgi:CHAT domain-containing protein
MHSFTDPDNSKYSCLMFDTRKDTLEDGKLFNYEISLSRINSPMVVLSSCNTGSGTLSHGEGIMSMARGFILAGALSVVITSWDINDEASADIITRFYYHLSKGEKKAEALRHAKLEYLKTKPPVYTNPYYWAGFEVLGDNAPVVQQNRTSLLALSVILVLFAGVLTIYLRWRNILSARSR